MSVLPVSLAGCLFITADAQEPSSDGYVYVEAKEWNKKHPELPKWKLYPSMTVDSLPDIPCEPDRLNRYGSLEDGPVFEATGFFRTRKYGGRWIMVDPDGRMHIDAAVVGVRQGKGETNMSAFAEKFSDDRDWIVKTVDELASYGFNGAGTWSDDDAIRMYNSISEDRKFSYCPFLSLMAGYGRELRVTKQLAGNIGYPNQCIRVFDPGFEEYCERYFSSVVGKYRDDPNVLGYFSDNELPIGKNNLEGYLDLPEGDYGRAAAEKWLEERKLSREQITDAHRAEFAGYVADRYYSTVSRVLKKYDPDHMYLGSRLHGGAKFIREVVEAAGRYCDVISINYYGFWEVREKDIEAWEEWTDRPFIITEFYTKAEDSGLTNVTGAGWKVHTQKDRGIHYENFIIGLLRSRNCVGWSWFKYQDNDPTAKGVDPSNLNSNKGCFNNRYEPYTELVSRMYKVNSIRYGLVEQFNSVKKVAYRWPEESLGGGEKLFYDEDTFREIRDRIEKYDWAAKLYEELQERVSGVSRRLPYDYQGLLSEAYWTSEAAKYYRISGDGKYMRRVADNIIDFYALDRPEERLFPADTNRSTTYFWQRVMEKDSRYVLAYDLVRNHPFLSPYSELMQKRMAEIIEEGKLYESRIRRLGNTQFWGVTGIGLYGFMTGDNDAIRLAIDGKNGFKGLLAKFRDGGRFWPEPKHYDYGYVDCCMLMLAESARHNGWPEDLYSYEDPDNGASIHRMLEGFLSVCTPDGYLVGNGEHSEFAVLVDGKLNVERTSFFASEIIRENIKLPVYYRRFRDPEIAWAMSKRPANDFYCVQVFGNPALAYGGADNAEMKAPDASSVVWQEMGDALLRSDETSEYWNGKGLTVYMRNGASQQFHSNDDHCSININAFGKNLYNHWFLRWDYLCPRKGRTNATPLSFTIFNQNTVAVDCKAPDISNIHLGADDPERPGLQFGEIERIGNMKRLSVSGEAYEGVEQKRTICAVDEYVLDIFTLESSERHTYDYILHSWGKVTADGCSEPAAYQQLNSEYGFGPIDGKSVRRGDNIWFSSASRSVVGEDGARIDFFDSSDSLGIRAFVFPDRKNASELITAYTPFYVDIRGWDHGPYPGQPERKPMSVVRRNCKSTAFVAVHQPYSGIPDDMEVTMKGRKIIVGTASFRDTYDMKTGEYSRTAK